MKLIPRNRFGIQREKIEKNLGNFIPPHGGHHIIPPLDQFYNLRLEIAHVIEKIEIPARYHHHKVGRPGQFEIELYYNC